jgi:hypothetical protein
MTTAQKDKNDPFETHKKAGLFGSIWGSKQPTKTKVPAASQVAGGGKGYKEEEKKPAPPSFVNLFFFPMAYFIITALSFTLLWALNKAAPILIACAMLCTVFDMSSLGDTRNSRGEDVNGLLPSLEGKGAMKAMRVWLHIVVAWLAVFLGAVTGLNANESYMSQFYAITFGREYEHVLASTPGAAYSDAGKVWFATTSKVDSTKSIGFKEGMTFCAAPIMDSEAKRKTVAFWAIGYDCCDARGKFKCGAGHTGRGGVRAPPDGFFAQDQAMFKKAVSQSAAVHNLHIDEDLILLYWVEDPDHEAMTKFLSAIGADLIGAGLFALLTLLLVFIGLAAEHEMSDSKSSWSEDLS